MYRGSGRINEREVPESQHTVFIRGLPGNMSTDEIRDFFEKDFGSCTFDFVKVSPDRTKLYVAVRFDSKVSARDAMERFSTDGELLGYKVDMSWFRDIRRYLAHCAKQGIRPSRFRGRGDFRRDEDRFRGRERGRSRSPTRSPERVDDGRSRSASVASHESRIDGRRRSMSRSRSAQSRSRSRSLSSMAEGRGVGGGPAAHLDREKSLEYCNFDVKKERLSPPRALSPSPPPMKKSKREKRKKEKRQRRSKHLSPSSADYRQPHSGSDMEIGGEEDDEGEANGGKKLRHETSPKVFIGPVQPIVQPSLQQQQQQQQPHHVLVSPIPSPFYQRHFTAGAVAAAATNDAMLMKQQQAQLLNAPLLSHQTTQMMPKVELRNQSIMLDLSDPKNVSPPKFKPIGELVGYHHLNGSNELSNYRTLSPPPPPQPMLRNLPMPTVTTNEPPSVTANFFNPMTIQEPGLPLNNFREIQRAILQDVRYKAQEEEEDHIGHLRLSLLSRKGLTEEKREEKIAKMTPELRERISKKKRQLELSYRNDCEAYGLVVNKLIAKDRSLEERLKVALLETMKDLETETIKQLDEFLDQLSFCA